MTRNLHLDPLMREIVNGFAQGVPHIGICRATGNHRVAQNDEPEPRTFAEIEAEANAEARAIVRRPYVDPKIIASDERALAEQIRRQGSQQ